MTNKTSSAQGPRIVRLRHIESAVRQGGRSPGRLAKDFGLTTAQIESVRRIAELKRWRRDLARASAKIAAAAE